MKSAHVRFTFLLALVMSVLGCGGSFVQNSSPSAPTGYTSAATQLWSAVTAASSTPAMIANQSNPPADVVAGISGVKGGGFVTAGFTLGAYPGFNNPTQVAQAVVARYNANGVRLWVSQFGAGSGDSLQAVSIDNYGNTYVAGATNIANSPQALVAKFSLTGNRLWAKGFAIASGMTYLTGVAIDSNGGVAVLGASVAMGNLTSIAFAAHIDPGTGAVGWIHQYGNFTSIISPTSVTAGINGDLYVTGANLSSSSAGQRTTADVSHLDGGTGSQTWLVTLALPGEALLLTSVAINSDGNPVIAGAASNGDAIIVGFGADPSAHAYITELSSASGQSVWTTEPSTGTGDEISGLTMTEGKLYAVGSTNGSFASAYKAQLEGEFLMRFSAAGTVDWVQQFGTGAIVNIEAAPAMHIATDSTILYVGAPTQAALAKQVSIELSAWGP